MTQADFDLSQYEFVQVVEERELPPGERVLVEVDDQPIAVFNVSGKYYAIGDICTHDDGPLGEGELDGHEIICPRHGARFDIRSGKALTMPAFTDTPWYPTRTTDGWVEVGLPL
jgi:3-phenylpropionate/trans-cinnamate dioxygenase ferredoxin component